MEKWGAWAIAQITRQGIWTFAEFQKKGSAMFFIPWTIRRLPHQELWSRFLRTSSRKTGA